MSSQLPWHALKLQIFPRINMRWLPPRNQVLHSELLNSYLNQRYHSSDLLLVFWCNFSEWIGCRAWWPKEIMAGRVLSATTRKGTPVALHLRQLFHSVTSCAWNFVWKCEAWVVLCLVSTVQLNSCANAFLCVQWASCKVKFFSCTVCHMAFINAVCCVCRFLSPGSIWIVLSQPISQPRVSAPMKVRQDNIRMRLLRMKFYFWGEVLQLYSLPYGIYAVCAQAVFPWQHLDCLISAH